MTLVGLNARQLTTTHYIRSMATSRVSQHPATAVLAGLEQALAQLPDTFAAQQPDIVERARISVRLVRDRLIDPAVDMVSDNTLTNTHSWMQAMLSELQNAVAQGNPNVIAQGTNFYNNLEALAQNFHQFPVSQPVEQLTGMIEEANRRLSIMQDLQLQQEGAWRTARDEQARLLDEAREAKAEGLKRLEEQELAAGKLLAALGAQGTSAGYRGTSEAEKKQADFWRWVTIAGGVLTAVLAVILFWSIGNEDLGSIASRAGVTIPAILLTVYAGRQSAGHREQERQAKRLELSFGSVDAFLADLGPDSRAELKRLVSTDLFRSSGGVAPNASGDYPSSADLVGLLSQAIQRLR